MKFNYEALDTIGKEHKGVVEAISESKAIELMRNEGFFVTKMKKYDPNAKSIHLPSIVIFVGGILCEFLIAKLMNQKVINHEN